MTIIFDCAEEDSMRKRLPMTAWYNPILLVQTGIRVAISTVFGEMADRREAIAAANLIAEQPFDKSFDYVGRGGDGEIWFDFLADTGDGWHSTFAMAQLVTAAELEPEGAAESLPRGRLLILGGDQVYPTATREEYDNRFLYPFEDAEKRASTDREVPERDLQDVERDLYAIPGNHDWYDGLVAFFNLFCRRRISLQGTVGVNRPGRTIAGWRTQQTRSYFAVRLAPGWWLWGTDSQLKGYIDQPQIDFFQFVASRWMEDESRLVLCVGMPNWAYVDEDHPKKEFETFSYLERLASIARVPLTEEQVMAGKKIEDQPFKRHQLKLVLTGDSHHYSRYVEARSDGSSPVQYITCGGGGAFLHPTHHLKDRSFDWGYPAPGVAEDPNKERYPRCFKIDSKVPRRGRDGEQGGGESLFPDREASRALTRRNAGFAFRNWGMTGVFLAAYLLFNWLLNMNARVEGHASLLHALSDGPVWQAPLRYVWLAFVSPWPAMLFLAALGGYYYFADSPLDWRKRLRIGLLHGLAQAGAATLVTSILFWFALDRLFGSDFVPGVEFTLAVGGLILAASTVAAFVSATLFGLYLWISLNGFGRHWNEAFSSLAIADYKSFLRMRIRTDGALEIYPIGLEKVPTDGESPIHRAHLVEGPIIIS